MLGEVAHLDAAQRHRALTSQRPALRPSALQTRFDELQRQYDGTPLEVSFRDLVGPLPAQELSHGIYPYPARLLRQIPRMLMSCQQVVGDADFIVDPFCGSGTVLLEAQLAGKEAIGFDQNPIAALISRVKTTPINEQALLRAVEEWTHRAKRRRFSWSPPSFVRRWYSDEAISVLGRLAATLRESSPGPERDVFAAGTALLARALADTDKRIPVPVRPRAEHANPRLQPWSEFTTIMGDLMRALATLDRNLPPAIAIENDARDAIAWELLPAAKKGVLITSPPYGAAQKYVRSTSLEAAWLGMTDDRGTARTERSSVGREHMNASDRGRQRDELADSSLHQVIAEIESKNKERAFVYLNYFLDMQSVLTNVGTTGNLQRAVLVAGTNVVCGTELDTREHLSRTAEELGFHRVLSLRDEIRGRALMTKRRHKTLPGAAEYVEIFERSES